MIIKNATFIISAASPSQFVKSEKPIIAVAGKSNVGKSTFINIIAGNISYDEGEVIWHGGIRYDYLDQHADIDFVPGEDEGFSALEIHGRVDSRDQSLRRGFFVAR